MSFKVCSLEQKIGKLKKHCGGEKCNAYKRYPLAIIIDYYNQRSGVLKGYSEPTLSIYKKHNID